MDDTQQKNFAILRLNFYLAGRQLYFGKADFGGTSKIMLGYAVEHSLKQLISYYNIQKLDKSDRNIVTTQHKIKELYNIAKKHNLIPNIKVSDDLLEYVEINLNMRYPRNISEQISKSRTGEDKYLLKLNTNVPIGYYDDLILKLDDELLSLTNNPIYSIGNRAASQAGSFTGKLFFHGNVPAHSRFEKYKNFVTTNRKHHSSDLVHLDNGVDFFWNSPEIGAEQSKDIYDSEFFKFKSEEEAVEITDDGIEIISY